MYREFYGFRDKPFSLVIDQQFFYLSQPHKKVLDALKQSIHARDFLCVLTGKIGAGKTTLIRYLAENLGNDITFGLLSTSRISSDEFIPGLLAAFKKPSSGSIKELTKAFSQFVVAEKNNNKHPVLIIDDAQKLSIEILNILTVLINEFSNTGQGLTAILVGEPSLLETLNHPNLDHLSNKVNTYCELNSLISDETASYIQHRSKIASGIPGIFEDNACREIHGQTEGTPRSINLLCDSALVYGFVSEDKIITDTVVRHVVIDRKEGNLLPALVRAEEIARERLLHKKEDSQIPQTNDNNERTRLEEDELRQKSERIQEGLSKLQEEQKKKIKEMDAKRKEEALQAGLEKEIPADERPDVPVTAQSGSGKEKRKLGLAIGLLLVVAASTAGYMFLPEGIKTTISEVTASGITVFENNDLKRKEELKAREQERAVAIKTIQEEQERKAADLAAKKAEEQAREAALKAKQEAETRIKEIQEVERLRAEEEQIKAALEAKLERERAALLKAKIEKAERLEREEATRKIKAQEAAKAIEEAARKKAEEEALKVKEQELAKEKQMSIERVEELEAKQKEEAYRQYIKEIQQLEKVLEAPFE